MNRNEDHSSDSEPEEVSKHVSEKVIKQELQGERSARVAARQKLKEKRRQEIERNTEQKRHKKVAIERLPDELLNELDVNEFTSLSNPNPTKEITEKKSTVSQKRKRSAVKKLDTPATEFKVMSLDEVSAVPAKTLYDKTSCFTFRDRMLFGRKHNKRVRNWRVRADEVKRSLRS